MEKNTQLLIVCSIIVIIMSIDYIRKGEYYMIAYGVIGIFFGMFIANLTNNAKVFK